MALTELLYYIGLEFLAFLVVDVVVKSLLREAGNEAEKKTIWLYESGGLGFLCAFIYALHHTPYILFTMTCITFIYTQFLSHTDPTRVFSTFLAHWHNHELHQENMKNIERQKLQQQQLQQQALGLAGLNSASAAEINTSINHAHQMNYGYPYFGKQQQGQQFHYPPNATVVPGQDRPTYSVSPMTAVYQDAVKQGRMSLVNTTNAYNWNSASDGYVMANINNAHNMANNSKNILITNNSNSAGRMEKSSGVVGAVSNQHGYDQHIVSQNQRQSSNNLVRRSLHNGNNKPSPKTSPSFSALSTIKSKFMNVLGSSYGIPKPMGLVNSGQNMCFINATLQCLSRGPYLVECLTADAAKELECTVAESELLSSLSELLDLVTADPANSDYKVFNPARFRKAASVLNPDLIAAPNEFMRQQDAAEFLMWLLQTVHNILNKNSQVLQCGSVSEDRFSSPRLANLRLIYGDLNANRIKELKDQCRREIAVANGLENESYAEAIQRLSDLEWLTHKQSNDTVIDGLFTGQLVEAYHSLEHGHISVNLQSFNILPVPIASPRYQSGLVMLNDCFTSFCNIENLCEMPAATNNDGDQSKNSLTTSYPLVRISDNRLNHQNINANKTELFSTPVTRNNKTTRPPSLDMGATFGVSPIHQSVVPSPILSSHVPSSGFNPGKASPALPSAIRNKDCLINDSGFHDNAFKTSTPILDGTNVAPRSFPKLQRRCLLRQLPECLIIQLMRFQYDQSSKITTKVNTPVSVRLKGFDLKDVIYDTVTQRNDLTAPNRGYVYELYGICLHLGACSTSHGHYISYCLDGDKWYRMDDELVEEVNIEYHLGTDEIRQNAYMLFYRKMTLDSV